jgi:hypothetical protein
MSWLPPDLLAQLAFMEGEHRPALGAQALAASGWIISDAALAEELTLKRALLRDRRDQVSRVGTDDAAAWELLRLLSANLAEFHPDRYRREGDGIVNLVTGEAWDLISPALHPLEVAARLVQEDFCLLAKTGDEYRLRDAAVCFPTNWLLSEKFGSNMTAIHAPVPDYAAKLGGGVRRLFDHLRPGRLVWRSNWQILEQPELFQPVRLRAGELVTAENAGSLLWLRAERQTLQRLPATGAIVFTIRTFVDRLEDAARDPAVAQPLAATLRSMPVETVDYRNMAAILGPLLGWLDACLGRI